MPFPTTPLLDTFNRSALGSTNWADAWGDGAPALITANQLGGTNPSPGTSGSYWTPRTFFDTELYVTIAAAPTAGEIVWLLTRASLTAGGEGSPPTGQQNCYFLRLESTGWVWGRIIAGGTSSLASGAEVPAVGDRWGHQQIGSAYQVWRCPAATGVWGQLASGTDLFCRYGYLGVEFQGQVTRIDDWSGGVPTVASDTNRPYAGRGAIW